MIPLLAEIERILLRDWDPIGVQDFPTAADEYDSYALQIYLMLQTPTRPSVHEIAAYLNQVQTEHMGLGQTSDHNQRVAAMIAALQG